MRLQLDRATTLVAAFTVPIAGVFLYWSHVTQTSTWESGVLSIFGATFLLVVPLAFLTHSVETGIDSVRKQQDQISARQEQAASDVARLTEQVAQTQADLQLTQEQLSEVVRERIAATKDRDSGLFEAVGERPTRTGLLDALARAKKIGIISGSGCRVDLFGTGRYLRFAPEWATSDPIVVQNEDPDIIDLTLEEMDASVLRRIYWDDESDAADIAEQVAEAMQSSGAYPGDRLFDAGKIFADLSALLSLGHEESTSGKMYPVKHIIQLCPPQWAVCDDGVHATGKDRYHIAAWRLNEDWSHMREKPWVDLDSLDVALAICGWLYQSGALAVKPTRIDEPPF